MDTNSHMMCGKLSYKYLSLCCDDCYGEKSRIINLLNENVLIGTSDGDAVHPEYTIHSGFSKHTSMFGIFNVLECKSYSTFFISVFYNIRINIHQVWPCVKASDHTVNMKHSDLGATWQQVSCPLEGTVSSAKARWPRKG